MRTYYWEMEQGFKHGSFQAEDDTEARKKKEELQKKIKILVCYRESDTEDGLPFIEI